MTSYAAAAARGARHGAATGGRTPDAAAINSNPYVGKTGHTPRPSHDPAADGAFGATGRADLQRDQAQWDQAKAWGEDNDRMRAERFAAIDAAREAKRREWQQEAADAVVNELRRAYLGSDPLATAEDFDRDAPEILRQRRIAAAVGKS